MWCPCAIQDKAVLCPTGQSSSYLCCPFVVVVVFFSFCFFSHNEYQVPHLNTFLFFFLFKIISTRIRHFDVYSAKSGIHSGCLVRIFL